MASGPLQMLITRLARRELQDRISGHEQWPQQKGNKDSRHLTEVERSCEHEEMRYNELAASHRTIAEDRTRTGASVQ